MSVTLMLVVLCGAYLVGGAKINIVGGYEVEARISYMAALRSSKDGKVLCGAVLIAPRFLLTAAHCLNPEIKYATIGGVLRNGADAELLKITRHIRHPRYDEPTRSLDLAIIELQVESKLDPVAIDWQNDDALTAQGTQVWASGFGSTAFNSSVAPTTHLKEVQLQIQSEHVCPIYYKKTLDFPALLCVGSRLDHHYTCNGDSGGPLVATQNDGKPYLVGIGIESLDCGTTGKPGLFARVKAGREFINPFLIRELTVEPRPSKAPPVE